MADVTISQLTRVEPSIDGVVPYTNINSSSTKSSPLSSLFKNFDINVNSLTIGRGNNSISSNTALGTDSLISNTTGTWQVAVGASALKSNTTGYSNTALGYVSLENNTSGFYNTAVGSNSLSKNIVGNRNVAIGSSSMMLSTDGNNNVAIGDSTLIASLTSYYNVAVGSSALNSCIAGTGNTALGYMAMINTGAAVTAGNFISDLTYRIISLGNTDFSLCGSAVGAGVGSTFRATNAGTGTGTAAPVVVNNVSVGNNSLVKNRAGSNNTALGYCTLFNNLSSDYNTALGYNAGYNNLGSNNTFIGNGSYGSTNNDNNTINLGNGSITNLRCAVQTIQALSDSRDKTDITDLNVGLKFINDLKPVSFTWNTRDKQKIGIKDFGFIAQDLIEAENKNKLKVPNLVSDKNPDKLEASYSALIPILVKAIQELSERIK